MPDLVSILIPAYNAEKWIRDCISSAKAQTWPRKEIIVVVDDGSTDGTLSVVKRFESSGVKVVSQANRGASAARNNALSLARGEYIQWLDADDLLAPDKIALQMQAAHAGGSTTLLSSEFGEFLADPRKATFRAHSLWQNLSPIDFLLRKFTENVWMHPAAWLVSRRITETAGPWDERLSLDDDGEYFARIVAASQRIKFVPAARSYYRRANVGSLSRSLSESACESLLLSLRLCIGHLRSLEDSERARAASITLLQNWTDLGDCFYPDNEDRLWRVSQLAHELGGTLRPPRLSWKYVPIQWAFGWGTAKRAKVTVSNLKLVARLHFDRFSLAASRRQPSEFLP
jgi:glycosyltransferase involved in cell wall biosynthesis